jgi:hypothetical protein
MAYNTRSRRLKGARVVGCEPGSACLDCVKQLKDIALRGPRDFSFAAWVMKTAKAAWSRRARAQPGFVFPASTTRESLGGSILPFRESVIYRVSRSRARGAASRRPQAGIASGTLYPSPPSQAE